MNYEKMTIKEILTGLKNDKIDFSDLPETLRDNKEIVLEAIKYHNYMLNYASDRLKDDKEVILEALKHYNYILLHASERLKDDYEIVSLAIKKSVYNFYHASPRLQNEKELLEVLEKTELKKISNYYLKWYNGRMEILANFREKELLQSFIINKQVHSKKLKF